MDGMPPPRGISYDVFMKLKPALVALALLSVTGCASRPSTSGAPTLAELSADYRAAASIALRWRWPARTGGSDFRRDWGVRDDGMTKYGLVDFVPPLPSYLNEQGQVCSGGYVGWYMVVDSRGGKIVSWRFSDQHK